MIQSAFTNAYTNRVNQQTKGIGTISQGVKDAATLALGVAGFSGALGSGALAKGAQHALAGRVGGVGGNIMLSTLQEKRESAEEAQQTKSLFNSEEINQTIRSQLGDNPINNTALKKLDTVFATLQRAKDEKLINENGKYDTSIGEVDPNSELGKKITGGLDK